MPDTRFVAYLALLGLAGFAAAGEARPDAIAKLKQTGAVLCRPSLPFFCRNMHVSCSGRTSLPTFPFKLRAARAHGSIEPAPGAESFRKQYENGRVQWDAEGAYVILRPGLANGYIKLLPDGTYSFRHYSEQAGVMSLGRCD